MINILSNLLQVCSFNRLFHFWLLVSYVGETINNIRKDEELNCKKKNPVLSWNWLFLLSRSSARVLFSSRNPAVNKPRKWTHILYTSVASLAVGGGLCATPFRQVSGTHPYKIYSSHLQYMTNTLSHLSLCVPAAGWRLLSWLSYQTSSFSGDGQFKHFSLSDHLGSHRCHHRVL